jgi:HlyD family secretion protein
MHGWNMSKLEDLRIDLPVPKPRRRSRAPIPPWMLLLIIAALSWWQRERITQIGAALSPAREVRAQAIAASGGTPAGSITAGGYLEAQPPGPTIASALVEGLVETISVNEGDTVKMGDVIAQLDSTIYKSDAARRGADVKIAQAQLESLKAGYRGEDIDRAKADIARTQAALDKAMLDEQRFAELLARGVVSQAEYEAMKSALGQAQGAHDANLAALRLLETGQRKEDIAIAQAHLDGARAALAAANTLVERCKVRAPISGVVFTRYIQPGAWVSPGDNSEHPGAILSIGQPGQVQAWADINQRDLARVTPGQRVEMVTDSEPTRKIPGVVLRLQPVANLQKNTVQAKISITDPPADLRPDMSVQITFLEDEDGAAAAMPEGVVVPKEAIVQLDGKSCVFVLQGGKAVKRTV